ncbi:MAG: hypothetical protein D6798_16805, partial [Deltaproteobacteria bacterium]
CTAGDFPGRAELRTSDTELFGVVAEVELEGRGADGVPILVWVEDADGVPRSPPVEVPAGGAAQLPVRGLAPGSSPALRVVADEGGRRRMTGATTVEVAPVPADWPACSLTVPDTTGALDADAVICTNGVQSADGRGLVYCVDREGQPRWAVPHPGGAKMRVMEPIDGGGFAAVSMSNGKVDRFDATGALQAELSVARFSGQTRFVHEWIDPHEVIELREGPWAGALAVLTVASDVVEIDGADQTRLAYGILVFDPATEEVLWDWSAHGELGDDVPIDPALDYRRLGASSSYATDFMHANALVHHLAEGGEQRFTMSLRHQDWIVEVDVDSDAILWRLGDGGDFTLVEDLDGAVPLPRQDWFYAQHAPAWVDSDDGHPHLLVFDNGVHRPETDRSYSRVIELALDVDRGLAAPVFTWGEEEGEGSFFGLGGGDADLLPGGDRLLVLKGWDAAFAAVVGYPGGEVLWRMDCADGDDEDEPYRARYAPDLYALDGWGEGG